MQKSREDNQVKNVRKKIQVCSLYFFLFMCAKCIQFIYMPKNQNVKCDVMVYFICQQNLPKCKAKHTKRKSSKFSIRM